jgi:hypothetical protein
MKHSVSAFLSCGPHPAAASPKLQTQCFLESGVFLRAVILENGVP